MAWARVDDGWWCHPKVLGLGLADRGLWVSALSWSCAQRTDRVPPSFLGMVGATAEDAGRLVLAGLWREDEGGYRIHDWSKYQDLTLSEKRAEAGRKGGVKSGKSRSKPQPNGGDDSTDGDEETSPDLGKHEPNRPGPPDASGTKAEPNGEAGARPVPSRPDPSRPDPSRKSTTLSPTGDGEAERQFAAFWEIYPKRNGKRVGKGNALIEWHKLTYEQRKRAYIGARHLAASDTLPKDPERFLRRAKGGKGDYPFEDWQEPDVGSRDASGDDLRAAARALREAGR